MIKVTFTCTCDVCEKAQEVVDALAHPPGWTTVLVVTRRHHACSLTCLLRLVSNVYSEGYGDFVEFVGKRRA